MIITKKKSNRVLSVFGLVMINVIAIDSLRNLPANANAGPSITVFYLIASLLFLLPCVLITAELATHRPKTGGAYVWVREAFGPKWGFMNIWLQWVYNVFWYPTILVFIAVNLAYLINPALANHLAYLLPTVIGLFLLATIANWYGMNLSSLVSTFCAIAGTLIPMLIIIALGVSWIWEGKITSTTLTLHHLTPRFGHINNFAFMVVVFFSLMGIEMSAVHAEEVENPQRNYPRALIYSSIIIVVTMICASTAIAVVVPYDSLNIISGLNQAFELFFNAFHIQWMMPVVILLMVIGGFGGMAAWIIGPSKGLMVAAEDGDAPKCFSRRNKKGAPTMILITQAVVTILLSCCFLFFKVISTWYWILSDLTAELALLFYVILFAAAIRLRYITPHQEKAYRIPGGKIGIWMVGLIGMLSCIGAMIVGFIPPASIEIKNIFIYESILISGTVIFAVIPLIIYYFQNKKSASH